MRILVRYGEIGLKSRQVRKKFEDKLINNIDLKVDGKVFKENNRIFTEVPDEETSEAVLSLRKTPGIVSVSPCVRTSSDPEDIWEELEKIVEEYYEDTESFALDARRAGGHEFTSEDLEEELGQKVVDNYELKVDLENPDLRIYIEVRNNNTYLYTEKIDCIGGLPIGIEGTTLLLLEDKASIVAGISVMKRGCEIIPLFRGEDSDEIRIPMEILRSYYPDIKLLREDLNELEEVEKIAEAFGCEAIVLGSTFEDIKEEEIGKEVEIPILKPNCSLTESEVLEKYNEFRF